jgi:hypothetical protein
MQPGFLPAPARNIQIRGVTSEKECYMSHEENKEFIRRYLDAINGKPKPESVLRLFIAEQPLIDHILTAEASWPLYGIDSEEMVAEGDLVSLRGKVRGVQNGPFMGLPSSGKPVDFAIFITYKVQGGKIVDHWMLTDNMTMMQQMGLLPTPA